MKRTALIAFVLVVALPLTAQLDRKGEAWVERTLRSMSLDERIGQLIFPTTPGGFKSATSEEYEKFRKAIVDFHVGGYHTFSGDPASAAIAINDMQRLAKVPLLITADLEGGPGYIFFGATRLPLAMAIAATGDESLAYEAGKATAEEGRAVGVHVNFYPVADVQNNPRNPIINIRSFGEDPAAVSKFVRAYIRGTQENGQIATAKHFPGHGDVAADSHLEMPTLDIDRARLDRTELPPFRAAIEQGVGAVMSAHIHMTRLEKEKIPATLSHASLGALLRDEMKFEGLLFTDAMTMRAVSRNFKDDDATVRAIEAGSDIILHPVSFENSFNALKAAVESGRISRQRIDESVRRILRAKAGLGLHRPNARFTDLSRLSTALGSQAHRDLATKISESALTLVRDQQNALPLTPSPDTRVLQINVLDSRSGWREGAVGRVAAAELAKRFPRAVTVQIDDQSNSNELDMARKLAQFADVIVVNGFIRVAAYKGSIDLTGRQMELLKELATVKKPFVFSVFGSPYVLEHLPELPSYIVTYDISPSSEAALIRAITGEIDFRGKLPVSLPGLHPVGHGVSAQ